MLQVLAPMRSALVLPASRLIVVAISIVLGIVAVRKSHPESWAPLYPGGERWYQRAYARCCGGEEEGPTFDTEMAVVLVVPRRSGTC